MAKGPQIVPALKEAEVPVEQRRELPLRECSECHKQFVPDDPRRKTCSQACAKARKLRLFRETYTPRRRRPRTDPQPPAVTDAGRVCSDARALGFRFVTFDLETGEVSMRRQP